MFIEDGQVILVTYYYKGYQMSGDVKIIQQYLPREVGELLVWYVWLVQLFQRQIDGYISRRPQIPTHIWASSAHQPMWTSERLRHIMERESAIGMNGQTLTIALYREIAIAISHQYMRQGRRFVHGTEDQAAPEDDEDETQAMARIADEQAGHSAHTAGAIYTREMTKRMGEVAD